MNIIDDMKIKLSEKFGEVTGFSVFADRNEARRYWRETGGNLFEVWKGNETAWVVIWRHTFHLVDTNWGKAFTDTKTFWIMPDERGYNHPPFSFSFVTDYKYECEWPEFTC